MALDVDLSGRRAVVTGAGKGIGREIALDLARAGADVFGVSRTPSDLESLAEEVSALSVKYASATIDLRDKSSAEQVAAEAEASLGDIDVLVNNAGISFPASASEVTEEQWDETMNVNAKGAFFLSQALGRGMAERGLGTHRQRVVPGRHRRPRPPRYLRGVQGGDGYDHEGACAGMGWPWRYGQRCRSDRHLDADG